MKYYLTIFAVTFSLALSSQSYQFDNYNNQDGLAQSQANIMFQDHAGYIWVGTVIGLCKFDSHQFQNYYKKDGLLDNNITAIFEDAQNRLWVGTKGGISLKKISSFKSFEFPDEINQYKILDIISLDDETILLATDGGGLIKFNTKTHQFEYDKKNKDYIRKILPIDNTLLLATPEGLFQMNKNDTVSEKTFVHADLKNISITDIEDVDGQLWISTYKKGVFRLTDGNLEQYTERDNLVKNDIRDIEAGSNNKIWFASSAGISCFENNEFINIDADNGLSNPNIQHLMNDKNGSMWLASKGQGVFRFSGWLFKTMTKKEGLQSDIIMTIVEDVRNNIWFGSYDEGVSYITPSDSIVHISELGMSPIWSSLVTSHGEIWFGTSKGIKTYNNGEVKNFVEDFIFDGTRITALHEDRNGVIWIGHKDGLTSFDGEVFQDHLLGLDVPLKRIRAIAEIDGHLWLGGEYGLFWYDGNIISHYSEEHGLSDNRVNSLTFDNYGRLWIGTNSGLDYMENDLIRSVGFKSKDYDPVNFLLHDKNRIFIGSNYGLHELIATESFDHNNPEIRHFNKSYGMPDLECNLNAIRKVNDEDIYFGTSKGLVNLDLNVLNSIEMKSPPDVQITGIRIFMLDKDLSDFSSGLDEEMGLYENLKLQPNDNHITFDFTGISYSSPTEVRYKYRLIGADSDWLPVTKSNFVTYSYLPHGDYTFELMASDENSSWTATPQQYSFTIEAPYYLKGWFLILSGICSIALLYLLYKWRKMVVNKKNETELIVMQSKLMDLEQQSLNSSMNRHFIFNALNSIQYYINREDKRAANTYLTNFAKLIRKNLDSTENNWTTLHDELERIELYLSMEHMRFKNRFEYEINISDDIDVHQIEIPPMLFQPFLENSIWHGILPKQDKGTLTLDISKENDLVKIKITDDGIGLQQSKLNKNGQVDHESKGMEIINSRIKLFGSMTKTKFDIIGPDDVYDENNTCIGTKVEIHMPIVKNVILN